MSSVEVVAHPMIDLMDVMPQILWTTSAEGHLEYGNLRWQETLGAPQGARVDAVLSEWVHPEDRHTWRSAWMRAWNAGTSFEIEHRVVTKSDSDSHWYLECGTPIRDTAGCISRWVFTATQIDEHKHREAEIRALLSRKDEFLTVLLHELRNPLAPMSNAVELLRRHGGDTSTVAIARGIMQRQLRQITRLVDDLLDVSRVCCGKIVLHRRTLDLADVVSTAIETAQPILDTKSHALCVSVPDSRFMVEGDATRLAQVIANLLINAAKYTSAGGQITVMAEEQGGHIRLRVRDNGIGIAREHLARVFDLFAQAGSSDARMGGLGVGLTVARQLIELHGGSISVQSDGPGRGSEFTISLPKLS